MKFIDLQMQQARIRPQLEAAFTQVLSHGQYIMGPEVEKVEARLCAYMGAPYGLSCANGTDALILALRAWGIGAGDAVFCPSFSFVATAEAIRLIGAQPVFVDINRTTYTLCPQALECAIRKIQVETELTPKALIAVDLFGQSADYPVLAQICARAGMKMISDSAQGFGCRLYGQQPIAWADIVTTSFFPSKPLGCYGDGGAVFCREQADMQAMASLRNHGQGAEKYEYNRVGFNSRLDSLQAAILLEKLAIFDDELEQRQVIANRYNAALEGTMAQVPCVIVGGHSTWAIYTIEVPDRVAFITAMASAEIPTPIYYPLPLHRTCAYASAAEISPELVNTEAVVQTVVSLPFHPYLQEQEQEFIISTACKALS